MTTPNRFLLQSNLRPVLGDRFQPTGFPDIGAATFERPDADADWIKCLAVESPQSMANRLEGTAWNDLENRPVDVFDGLPYVRVVGEDGNYVTSSRTEAHRLASAFIKESKLGTVSMMDEIKQRLNLGDDRPLSTRDIATAVFALDPFCLVHGVFFAAKEWPGQPKIARALNALIDAIDVKPAESGGVKKDHVRHANVESGGSSEGYGSIPFHRTEWTAREIVASFSIDRAQLRSYGLPDSATALLDAIARWEIRSLLDDPMRLRTSCDLEPIDRDFRSTVGGEALPTLDDLSEEIRAGIAANATLFAQEIPLEVTWVPKNASKSTTKESK